MAEINFWWKVEDQMTKLGILKKGREKWGKKLNEKELEKAYQWVKEKLQEEQNKDVFAPSKLHLPMIYDHYGYEYGQPATYGVGVRKYTILHPGSDLNRGVGNADLNDPAYAIADGVVTYKGWATGFGWHMFVLHNINHKRYGIIKVWAHYMHLKDQPRVKVGDRVLCGSIIGRVGSTGTTISHLHFEIRKRPLGINFWGELKGKDRKELDEIFYNPQTFFI